MKFRKSFDVPQSAHLYGLRAVAFRAMVVYVDVDDTLIRTVGAKRIPMPATVRHIRELKADGAELYLWSSGGASYAQQSAEELGISDLFTAFLPKPQIVIDDQEFVDWRALLTIHPNGCESGSLAQYQEKLASR